MSGKLIVMAGLAVVFGATSYYAGNEYLESQAEARLRELEGSVKPVVMEVDAISVVVAAKPLKFGDKLTKDALKVVPWPKDALPAGSHDSIDKIIGNGERKVIQAIEPNEPVIDIKLTGANGRAGLAGIISEGMRAVTIPVDSVRGVGGFVMPGDRVDVVFLKDGRGDAPTNARIILQNVKVLSVDQDAISRADAAKLAKTITLETDADGAKTLALATSVGTLSLLLRGAGDEAVAALEEPATPGAPGGNAPQATPDQGIGLDFLGAEDEKKKFATVKVVWGRESVSSTVPVQEVIDSKKAE